MQRTHLYLALAACLGLAAGPVLAAPPHKTNEVNTLKALIEKQQQQLDQQQQALQQMRQQLQQLETRQAQPPSPPAQASTPPPPAPAPTAPAFASAPGVTVSLHGWIDATYFHQNRSFAYGNGQNALWPVPGSAGSLSGGDVRNTRFWLDFSGARLGPDWTGGGHLEMDFFGGYNGTTAYSQSQQIPRLRQAYLMLSNPGTGSTVQIGQQWDLLLGNIPVSLTHIAFPLGIGSGWLGWRFPGVVWMQELDRGTTGPHWRLDLGAFAGHWNGPGDNVNYLTAGDAGFRPQLEARLHVQDHDWSAYAVVHYAKVNLAGVGNIAPTPVASSVTSEALEVGTAWSPGPWAFQGNLYTGKGLGPVFGAQSQFGNLQETGGWGQLSYHFTPHWSANAFYAYAQNNTADVIAWLGHGSLGYLKNRQAVLSVLYNNGPYGFGLEWLHDVLDYTRTGTDRASTSGNQLSLSAIYRF